MEPTDCTEVTGALKEGEEEEEEGDDAETEADDALVVEATTAAFYEKTARLGTLLGCA